MPPEKSTSLTKVETVIAGCIVVAAVALLAIALGSAFHFRDLYPGPLNATDGLGAWANYATFMSFVTQTVLGAATLALAALLSGVLTSRLDARRAKDQCDRELVRLSERWLM